MIINALLGGSVNGMRAGAGELGLVVFGQRRVVVGRSMLKWVTEPKDKGNLVI